MITNIFISALVTLFSLGNLSKEKEEKTDRASWPRTFFYFLLFLIFGLFFLQTFQVSTILNDVTLMSLRGSEDSLHHSKDTIENVMLSNNFKALGSYRNPLIEHLEKSEDYTPKSGLSIQLKYIESTPILQNRSGLTDEKRSEIESLTGLTINSGTGPIYQLELMSTTIPSFIPLLPNKRNDIPEVEKEKTYSTIQYAGNISEPGNGRIVISQSDIASGDIANGISTEKIIVSHGPAHQFQFLGLSLPLVNTMNIFTAADLSQYTYCIALHSDMYVKNLSVAYNIPVEIVNQSEGVIVSANGFSLSNPDMLNTYIKDEVPMMFLLKLPTMANLQQIRSLILTALVTAFFSLFCTNLFYRLRKKVRDCMKEKNLDPSEEHFKTRYRVEDVKFIFYTLSFIIMTLLFIAAVMAVFDYVFIVDYASDGWIILLTWFFIIGVSTAAFYYFFFYDQKSKNKKKGRGQKDKVNSSKIVNK